jgi:DNA (cytosine-5)-methyltransferase 1
VKPRLLDLFCGAGGAAVGYSRAGFDVVGVDIKHQKNYPFHFVQMDALEALRVLIEGSYIEDTEGNRWYLSDFDAVHASPPCQGYSYMSNNLPWHRDRVYPLLILPTREALRATGKLFVIENVMGARKGSKVLVNKGLEDHGMEAAYLCGLMFGMPLYRHRVFESNFMWMIPGHPKHTLNAHPRSERFVYGGSQKGLPGGMAGLDVRQYNEPSGGHASGWETAAQAMGVDWMKRDEITQSIPPAYTEFIGKALMKQL